MGRKKRQPAARKGNRLAMVCLLHSLRLACSGLQGRKQTRLPRTRTSATCRATRSWLCELPRSSFTSTLPRCSNTQAPAMLYKLHRLIYPGVEPRGKTERSTVADQEKDSFPSSSLLPGQVGIGAAVADLQHNQQSNCFGQGTGRAKVQCCHLTRRFTSGVAYCPSSPHPSFGVHVGPS